MTNIDQQPECAEKRVSKMRQNDKTKISFWKRRIFKPVYVRDGVKITSPNFCVELQHQHKRVRWSLGPANAEVAAAKARDLFLFLISNGWEATLERYRPASVAQPDPTIAAFLVQVEKTADLSPKTLRSYVASLRKIVTDSFGLDDPRKRGSGKGRKEWLEKVGAVRLSELTPARIQEWKRSFLAATEADPLSQRSAKVSVNSFLRCARSLFSPGIIKHLSLELPSPLPFASVTFEPRPSLKYRSTFDVQALIPRARDELALSDPEAYKVFLLATFAGLRRKEIDLLEWSSFRWDECTIRIETTAHFSAKSEDSLGDVAVDRQLMDLFRGYYNLRSGSFVIESPEPPRSDVLYNYYRAELVFNRLIQWLRAHGVAGNKPLHALRKEFGSEVCKHAGIYAASRALRHADLKVTLEHYVENRAHTTCRLGYLLESPKVVPFAAA